MKFELVTVNELEKGDCFLLQVLKPLVGETKLQLMHFDYEVVEKLDDRIIVELCNYRWRHQDRNLPPTEMVFKDETIPVFKMIATDNDIGTNHA